jgi:hypothetical protein
VALDKWWGIHAPHVGVGDVPGRALVVGELRVKTLPFSRKTTVETTLNVASKSIEFLDQIRATFDVAPTPIFRERLGASRVRSLRSPLPRPLTRPARSRVVGNYRSDGEIRAPICFAFPRTSAIHQADYSPVS